MQVKPENDESLGAERYDTMMCTAILKPAINKESNSSNNDAGMYGKAWQRGGGGGVLGKDWKWQMSDAIILALSYMYLFIVCTILCKCYKTRNLHMQIVGQKNFFI